MAVGILYCYMGRRLQEPEAALKAAAPQYKTYNGKKESQGEHGGGFGKEWQVRRSSVPAVSPAASV